MVDACAQLHLESTFRCSPKAISASCILEEPHLQQRHLQRLEILSEREGLPAGYFADVRKTEFGRRPPIELQCASMTLRTCSMVVAKAEIATSYVANAYSEWLHLPSACYCFEAVSKFARELRSLIPAAQQEMTMPRAMEQQINEWWTKDEDKFSHDEFLAFLLLGTAAAETKDYDKHLELTQSIIARLQEAVDAQLRDKSRH